MGSLLHFEFRKLSRSVCFYICGGLSIVLLLISISSIKLLSGLLTDLTDVIDDTVPYDEASDRESNPFDERDPVSFEISFADTTIENYGEIPEEDLSDDLETLKDLFPGNTGRDTLFGAFSLGDILLLLAIFISIFVCTDFSGGTLKNIVAKGYSRKYIFLSKYIVCLVGSLIITVLSMAAAFGLGTAFFGIGTGWRMLDVVTVLVILLGVTAYVTIDFFIAVWLKKTGAVIAVTILNSTVVSLLLSLLDALLHLKDFSLNDFWLSSVFTAVNSVTITGADLAKNAGYIACYIAVFGLLSWLCSRKVEV